MNPKSRGSVAVVAAGIRPPASDGHMKQGRGPPVVETVGSHFERHSPFFCQFWDGCQIWDGCHFWESAYFWEPGLVTNGSPAGCFSKNISHGASSTAGLLPETVASSGTVASSRMVASSGMGPGLLSNGSPAGCF